MHQSSDPGRSRARHPRILPVLVRDCCAALPSASRLRATEFDVTSAMIMPFSVGLHAIRGLLRYTSKPRGILATKGGGLLGTRAYACIRWACTVAMIFVDYTVGSTSNTLCPGEARHTFKRHCGDDLKEHAGSVHQSGQQPGWSRPG